MIAPQHIIDLRKELNTAGSDMPKDIFATLFKKARDSLEMSDIEIHRLLKISLPTIVRWANGESAPHQLGRFPAISALLNEAEQKEQVAENNQ